MAIPQTPCQYAIERHRNLLRWRNLWTILLFAFGLAVISFLCVAVLFILRTSWLPGAVSALGTLVSSVGVRWVVDRRTDAKTEEESAYADVRSVCLQGAAVTAESEQTTPSVGDDSLAKLAAEKREKYKLIGNII